MKYTYIKNDGIETIVALVDGELYTATNSHLCWLTIKSKCEDGTVTATDFDAVETIVDYLELANGLTVEGGNLYLDGEQVHGLLADKIVDSVREGLDATPLVNFMNKLMENPSRNSRDQLFNWLDRSGFELTDDGDIVGYKSVIKNGDAYLSVASGTASVNGYKITGQIPQSLDDVVTMPRSEVTDNPADACSYGLHVGTRHYADHFTGDTVLVVHVNPADVVSVPHDSDCEKMRVCRYDVVAVYEPEKGALSCEGIIFNSSFLSSAQYDGSDLTIRFKNGKEYVYYDVDEYVWSGLCDADWFGTASEFFISNIRNEYEYELV